MFGVAMVEASAGRALFTGRGKHQKIEFALPTWGAILKQLAGQEFEEHDMEPHSRMDATGWLR